MSYNFMNLMCLYIQIGDFASKEKNTYPLYTIAQNATRKTTTTQRNITGPLAAPIPCTHLKFFTNMNRSHVIEENSNKTTNLASWAG